MASKKVHQVTLKGDLDLAEMTVTEETKDSIDVYSLADILRDFDGKQIAITLKEEEPLPVKEEV